MAAFGLLKMRNVWAAELKFVLVCNEACKMFCFILTLCSVSPSFYFRHSRVFRSCSAVQPLILSSFIRFIWISIKWISVLLLFKLWIYLLVGPQASEIHFILFSHFSLRFKVIILSLSCMFISSCALSEETIILI